MAHRIREAQSQHHVTRELKRSDDILTMEGWVRRIMWADVVYPSHGNVGRVRERHPGGCLAR